MPFKVSDCDNLLEIVNSNLKGFQYVKMDSESIAEQWRKLLGDTKPTKPRKLKQGYVYAAANIAFKDANSGREYQCGEVFQMQEKRARKAHEQGFVDIIE